MSVRHENSLRKKTGGRTHRYRKSRKHDLGSEFSAPSLGERVVKERRKTGTGEKKFVKRDNEVNLATEDGVVRAEIGSVESNPANSNYVRRSLLTKGTVIETSEGKARITSRPGQEAVINAELVE